MNDLKKILKYPIKRTFIIIGITFGSYVLLFYVAAYLSSIAQSRPLTAINPSIGDMFLQRTRTVVSDLYFICRLILEASFIVLIAQVVYRIVRK